VLSLNKKQIEKRPKQTQSIHPKSLYDHHLAQKKDGVYRHLADCRE
jgi:hypothetical protein